MSILSIIYKLDFDAVSPETVVKALVGYIIVFSALVALYFLFYFLPKVLGINIKVKRKAKPGEIQNEQEVELSGEVNAAISMALYLYFNQYHDEESSEMTIKRESRLYSPWSSKIYQVRNQFNRL